jgi:hypothetical protein
VPGEAVARREEDAVPEDGPPAGVRSFSGRTAWAWNLQTPLRVFLRTETGSAAVLLGMALAALAWVIMHRPSGRRPGDGPADLRVSGGPDRSGACERPVPQLPRAADPDLAQSARAGLASALSSNERLASLTLPHATGQA